MIVFIVPVKSKKLSADWRHFSRLVERTLRSVCQQTEKNFKVIAVCHEMPETNFINDNLQFVQVDFDPPILESNNSELNNSLKEKDKALKIKVGIETATNFTPDFYMVVDSDDCISNKIVAYLNTQPKNTPGWYMKKGYFYREGQRYAFLNKQSFNRFCGTSLIINATRINDMFVKNPLLSFNHKIDPALMGLVTFPFPGALYSMGNGENHVMSNERMRDLLNRPKKTIINLAKSIISKTKKYRPQLLTKNFKKEFNF